MMIIINIVESLLSIVGVLASLVLLYVSGTGEIEKVRHAMQSWDLLSKYFTALALVFALISVVESAEMISEFFNVNVAEAFRTLYIFLGFVALVVILAITKILADCKEELIELGSFVFYGKFGITLLYIAVILISAAHVKNYVQNVFVLNFLLNVVFLAFLPLFLFIALRFRSYNKLIRKGDIVVLPHTIDVFVGVAASFTLFFASMAFRSLGEFTMYNLLEACSLLIFVLVSVSYGKEVEELIKAANY